LALELGLGEECGLESIGIEFFYVTELPRGTPYISHRIMRIF